MPFYLNIYRYGDGFDELWLDYRIEEFSGFDRDVLNGAGTYGPFDTLPALADHLVNYCPMERQQFVPDIYTTAHMMELLDAWNRVTGHKAYVSVHRADFIEGMISVSLRSTGHDFFMTLHDISVSDIRAALDESHWSNG